MNELTEIIKSEILQSGPVTFERFTDLALYHEEYGYYSSGYVNIGRHGDFYTSPYVHSAFGDVLSKFILKGIACINAPVHTVLEIGAGKGTLARDILDFIKRDNPGVYRSLEYIMIEGSPSLIDQAQDILKDHQDKIRFIRSPAEMEDESIAGVVISNELFDSLPFHRAVVEEGRLREIYVSFEDNNFIEITGEPSAPELEEYIRKYAPGLQEGQQIEINILAAQTLRAISRVLKKGLVLTIDYGYLAPELFNPSRMKGTYKCMSGHTVNESPYINIGEQDITAHVDFSNLISAGKASGLNKIKYTTQGQFLIDWGILEVLEKMSNSTDESAGKKIATVKNLFMPGSMGDSFKTLLQEKNLGDALSGFYPDSPLKISFKTP